MKKIIPIVVLATTVSCNQAKVDKKAEGEKLMQLSKQWAQTIATKDVEKIVGY